MLQLIASIPVLVEDAAICLFEDAGRATESSPVTKVTSVNLIVVNKSVAKGIQSAAFDLAVQEDGQRYIAKPYSVDGVVKRMIYTPALTITVAKFSKQKIKKGLTR